MRFVLTTIFFMSNISILSCKTRDFQSSVLQNSNDGQEASFFRNANQIRELELRFSKSAFLAQANSLLSNPDAPPQGQKPIKASLIVTTTNSERQEFSVSMEARGNTSLESCKAFPKYKITLADSAQTGILSGVNTLRVGTHCPMNQPDTFGRVGGSAAVHREALAYQVVQGVFPELSLKNRVFFVKYTDEDNNTSEIQPALFLETDGQLARRTGLKRFEFEEQSGESIDNRQVRFFEWQRSLGPRIDREHGATAEMVEILLGNRDYFWRSNATQSLQRREDGTLWNAIGLIRGDKVFPVPTDFDIAGLVVGEDANLDQMGDRLKFANLSELASHKLRLLLQLKIVYETKILSAAKAKLLASKPQIEGLIELNLPANDLHGRQLAAESIHAFYEALNSPISQGDFIAYIVILPEERSVMREGASVDAKVLCTGLPQLFPVQVLGTEGEFTKVKLESALNKTFGCKDQTVGWIESAFLSPKSRF